MTNKNLLKLTTSDRELPLYNCPTQCSFEVKIKLFQNTHCLNTCREHFTFHQKFHAASTKPPWSPQQSAHWNFSKWPGTSSHSRQIQRVEFKCHAVIKPKVPNRSQHFWRHSKHPDSQTVQGNCKTWVKLNVEFDSGKIILKHSVRYS